MIREGKTIKEKFELIKKLGFLGVEIDSPGAPNLKEANEAQAATGIKILSTVDYAGQRNNVLVVAIAIGFGLIPIVSPNFFRIFPDVLKPIFGDGIILTSIAAVLLNAFFNRTSTEQAEADTLLAAQAAEHI